MAMCFVYTAVILGQPTGLSKGLCLYMGADWLKLICQSEGGGERSILKEEKRNFIKSWYQPSSEIVHPSLPLHPSLSSPPRDFLISAVGGISSMMEYSGQFLRES